jgi:hypothetical protein
MNYIPSDVPLHKKQEYVWFRGGNHKGFQDIRAFPEGDGKTPYDHDLQIPSDVPWHKNQGYVWLSGRDLNGFPDTNALSVQGGTGPSHIDPCTFRCSLTFLDIRNKNIYGLGVGISIVFRDIKQFPISGGWG